MRGLKLLLAGCASAHFYNGDGGHRHTLPSLLNPDGDHPHPVDGGSGPALTTHFGSNFGPLYIYDSNGAEVTDPVIDQKLRKMYWEFKKNDGIVGVEASVNTTERHSHDILPGGFQIAGGGEEDAHVTQKEAFMADLLHREFGYTFSKTVMIPTDPPTAAPTKAPTQKVGFGYGDVEANWKRSPTETGAQTSEALAADSEFDKALHKPVPVLTVQRNREAALVGAPHLGYGDGKYRNHTSVDAPNPVGEWHNNIVSDTPAVDTSIAPETVMHAADLHKTRTNREVRKKIVAVVGTGGSYDMDGTYQPPMKTNYDPQLATKCCLDRCNTLASQYFTDGSRADCVIGCGLWLTTSSLNWESTKWWAPLSEKCKKDCRAQEMRRMDLQRGKGRRSHETQTDFWMEGKVHKEPVNKKECQFGCDQYFKCL